MENLVITNKGQELITRLVAGTTTATFTKIETSDHNYSAESLKTLTALESVKQTALISSVTKKDTNLVQVVAAINNTDLAEGYHVRAVGLYARDLTNVEILYGISIETENPDYMPKWGGEGKTPTGITYYLNTKVDNSDQVSIEINPAAVATASDVQEISTAVDTHTKAKVFGETGVHGIRYKDETLQVLNNEGEWVDASTGGFGLAPKNCKNIRIKPGNGKITLYWEDPENTVVEGETVSTWLGTKLVQKAGSFPTKVTDGTLVLDNQERNKYNVNGYEINGLTNGTTYYFQLFPYSSKKVVNENTANRVQGTPQPYRVMTVRIDLSNSNPANCCTYQDDAAGMTPKSAVWDDFFGHYPVLFKNGAEVGRLKKTDFSKFESGGTADITSGNAGDVMIAFPRRGIKINTSGNILTVSMTDDPDRAGFSYLAHTRGSKRKEKFYLGAYKGYHDGSKLRSLSGKTPTSNQTIGTFRGYARNNGAGYDQAAFHQLTFRQVMYLLKYRNLNSQEALGKGYSEGNSAVTITGGTNTRGMDFGETTGKVQMKLFGLEDFWGNIREWVDGLFCNSNREILIGTDGFNDTGAGYNNYGKGADQNIGGYLSKVQGTSEKGFIAKEVSGSQTTFFSDYAHLGAGYLPYFGGSWSDGAYAGAFYLYVYYSASTADSGLSARLMYL